LGGDEWFSTTYLLYADLIRQLRIGELLKNLRIHRNPAGGASPFPGYAKGLLSYGVWPLLPDRLRSVIKRFRSPDEPALVSRAFAARTRLAERLATRVPIPRCRSFAQRELYRVYSGGFLAYPLEITARWSAGFRLEARHPLLDRRVMEFAFAIPYSQRGRGNLGKFVLREAMCGILPERVRLRTDKASPDEINAMALIGLGGERLFENLQSVKNGWVNRDVVGNLYRSMAAAYSRGEPSYEGGLWIVLAIELWLRIVFLGIDEPYAQLTEAKAAAI